ncbi:hypothetical protein EVAR_95892_1 [Eumeta japonica]|uniref:Uncharacterized protein n=1 Tax=Eumeta variegata TaxID=151549 RepID=A0A4C1XKY0_EUMVA|nr:hypothetical protein EVAR_95892_1 [Eumeta japonica]
MACRTHPSGVRETTGCVLDPLLILSARSKCQLSCSINALGCAFSHFKKFLYISLLLLCCPLMCRVTRRDAAASNFVPAIASIHSGSMGASVSIRVARTTSTNMTWTRRRIMHAYRRVLLARSLVRALTPKMDTIGWLLCVSEGDYLHRFLSLCNGARAMGQRMVKERGFHRASQFAFFIVAQSLGLSGTDLHIAQFDYRRSHRKVFLSLSNSPRAIELRRPNLVF